MSELSSHETIITEKPVFPKDDAKDNNKKGISKERLARLRAEAEHLVTEDDTPVDNLFSERQQRLLVDTLYSSWYEMGQKQPFVALANVGLFNDNREPPLVPDMLLSLNVSPPDDVWAKHNRSYFIWEYGKPPDIVIEVVSNIKGSEAGKKLKTYARFGVSLYVIFDPKKRLKQGILNVYELHDGLYRVIDQEDLPKIGLSLMLWKGEYEGITETWLRWYSRDGQMLLTGNEQAKLKHYEAELERKRADREQEKAELERQKAEQERQRAEREKRKAEQERQRVEHLESLLRTLGVDVRDI